ncbi:KGW motif small protein [Acinetobacter sp. CAAS 2-6]
MKNNKISDQPTRCSTGWLWFAGVISVQVLLIIMGYLLKFT